MRASDRSLPPTTTTTPPAGVKKLSTDRRHGRARWISPSSRYVSGACWLKLENRRYFGRCFAAARGARRQQLQLTFHHATPLQGRGLSEAPLTGHRVISHVFFFLFLFSPPTWSDGRWPNQWSASFSHYRYGLLLDAATCPLILLRERVVVVLVVLVLVVEGVGEAGCAGREGRRWASPAPRVKAHWQPRAVWRALKEEEKKTCITASARRKRFIFVQGWKNVAQTCTWRLLISSAGCRRCDRCSFPSQPTGCTNAVMMRWAAAPEEKYSRLWQVRKIPKFSNFSAHYPPGLNQSTDSSGEDGVLVEPSVAHRTGLWAWGGGVRRGVLKPETEIFQTLNQDSAIKIKIIPQSRPESPLKNLQDRRKSSDLTFSPTVLQRKCCRRNRCTYSAVYPLLYALYGAGCHVGRMWRALPQDNNNNNNNNRWAGADPRPACDRENSANDPMRYFKVTVVHLFGTSCFKRQTKLRLWRPVCARVAGVECPPPLPDVDDLSRCRRLFSAKPPHDSTWLTLVRFQYILLNVSPRSCNFELPSPANGDRQLLAPAAEALEAHCGF